MATSFKANGARKTVTRGHVVAKMGIATALVLSWEDSTSQPDNQQLAVIAKLLEFDAGLEGAHFA
jgi:hypothetical protein